MLVGVQNDDGDVYFVYYGVKLPGIYVNDPVSITGIPVDYVSYKAKYGGYNHAVVLAGSEVFKDTDDIGIDEEY